MRVKFPIMCFPVFLDLCMFFVYGGDMWLRASEVIAGLLCAVSAFIALNDHKKECEKYGFVGYFVLVAVIFVLIFMN